MGWFIKFVSVYGAVHKICICVYGADCLAGKVKTATLVCNVYMGWFIKFVMCIWAVHKTSTVYMGRFIKFVVFYGTNHFAGKALSITLICRVCRRFIKFVML